MWFVAVSCTFCAAVWGDGPICVSSARMPKCLRERPSQTVLIANKRGQLIFYTGDLALEAHYGFAYNPLAAVQ